MIISYATGPAKVNQVSANYIKLISLVLNAVIEIRIRNWLAIFMKIGYFIGY